MNQQVIGAVDKADLKTFHDYTANFWLFLQLDQQALIQQLANEKNIANVSAFATNYDIRFIILQKSKQNDIKVEVEWTQDMLSTCNILLIKKNNFNLYKGVTAFKISQMIQVVNLDFQN